MSLWWIHSLVNRLRPKTIRRPQRDRRYVVPTVTQLEDRSVPSTYVPDSQDRQYMKQQLGILQGTVSSNGHTYQYTNRWVVGVSVGTNAGQLASQAGAISSTTTGLLYRGFYWTFNSSTHHSTIANFLTQQQLNGKVSYFYPLLNSNAHQVKYAPNDARYPDQWHLKNTGQGGGTAGEDANLEPAWDIAANRGASVVIAVADDGLETGHQDLSPNMWVNPGEIAGNGIDDDNDGYIDNTGGWDFNNNDNDPNPSAGDSHGTSVAGVAAGKGDNSIGIAGAAFNARLVGLRILGGSINDQGIANAMLYKSDAVHVHNNSWGPADTGSLASPGPLTRAALQQGWTTGRGGRGVVYVWAGGNGQASQDNANYDGYANSKYTIAVGAINNQGVQSNYSEPGANLMVVAPSNGGTLGITTTDLNNQYTDTFGGTSSSTPLVAGVIGLMLDVNPNLSVRDIRQILARTARRADPNDSDWVVNGGGYHVNHKYGFGVVNAGAAVAMAQNWTNVGPEQIFNSGDINVNQTIPDNNPAGVTSSFNVTENFKVEQVFIHVNVTHTNRGDLRIELTSPSGTRSVLAETRTTDGGSGIDFTFSSMRHLGEDSQGTWTLRIIDGAGGTTGTWIDWSIEISGGEPGGGGGGGGGGTQNMSSLYFVPNPVNEGTSGTLVGQFTNPGAGQFLTHTVNIKWGDGSPDTNLFLHPGIQSFTANHTYADDGNYQAKVTVTPQTGARYGGTATMTVMNVAPTVTIIGAPTQPVPENRGVTLAANVTDAGVNDTHTFVWQVLKNGNPFATGTNRTMTFVPDDQGTYTASVIVTDDDGGVGGSTPVTINVVNVNPTAQLTSNSPRPTATPVTVTFINQVDAAADVAAGFLYSFDWNNDGVYEIVDQVLPSATNTFADGFHVVKGRIKDKDGGFNEYTTTVSVGIGGNGGQVHTRYVVAGTGDGGIPVVRVYTTAGVLKYDFLAYALNFRGGVRVATGDVNGDGVEDIITAAGPTGGPHVKVFDGTNLNLIRSFFAYSTNFTGGVWLAVGDVNRDGFADIITGAGMGGGPHVKVFDGATNGVMHSFFAFAPNFTGGVRVAAGDFNGDFRADIVTAAGPGGGPHVMIRDAVNLGVLSSFFPFPMNMSGGVFVATGDVNGDGRTDLITSSDASPLSDARVRVFNGNNLAATIWDFAPFGGFRGGVRVAADDLDGDGKADILVTSGSGQPGVLLALRGSNLTTLHNFHPFDPTFLGGVFVG